MVKDNPPCPPYQGGDIIDPPNFVPSPYQAGDIAVNRTTNALTPCSTLSEGDTPNFVPSPYQAGDTAVNRTTNALTPCSTLSEGDTPNFIPSPYQAGDIAVNSTTNALTPCSTLSEGDTPNFVPYPYQAGDTAVNSTTNALTCSLSSDIDIPSSIPSPDKGRVREGFPFIPYNPNLKILARENRKNPTLPEKIFWEKVLRQRQFNRYKFLRQKPIYKYIVDFYCSELRLAIEIDGEIHDKRVEYDTQRTEELEHFNVKILRFRNNDILYNLDQVIVTLSDYVKMLQIT